MCQTLNWIVQGQGVSPSNVSPVQIPILQSALSPCPAPNPSSAGSQPPQCSWTPLSPQLQCSPLSPGDVPLPVLPTQSTRSNPWHLDPAHPIPALALLSRETWAALQGLRDTRMELGDSDAVSAMAGSGMPSMEGILHWKGTEGKSWGCVLPSARLPRCTGGVFAM